VIGFRPLTKDDLPLLEEWLRREHVAQWRPEPIEQELEERRLAITGDRPSEYYVILLDGRPVGHIQTYLASDCPEWDAIVRVGSGVAGLDLLVGEEELVGQGLGPRVLQEFTRRVVFADPDIRACIATVAEANRRSWRAFEKASFRHVRNVEEDGLPCRLMRLDRQDRAA
jgi:aminoglycoside 6'-N-acetyltransferase